MATAPLAVYPAGASCDGADAGGATAAGGTSAGLVGMVIALGGAGRSVGTTVGGRMVGVAAARAC